LIELFQIATLLVYKIKFKVIHADRVAFLDARLTQRIDNAGVNEHTLEVLERLVIIEIDGGDEL